MIISDSQVNLQAFREAASYSKKSETLTVWQQGREPVTSENTARSGKGAGLAIRFESLSIQFSQSAHLQLEQHLQNISTDAFAPPVSNLDEVDDTEMNVTSDDELSLQIGIIGLLVEKITGRKIRLFDARELHGHKAHHQDLPSENPNQKHHHVDQSEQQQGWGIRYESEETHYESEKVEFQAGAVVKTADGREIEIDLQLSMSREFVSQEKIVLEAGDRLKDPLVINYAGNAASLTQQKYAFDIDSDGSKEQISFVEDGSGFLVYDKNGNGTVDNGSELFGAETGDGFNELAAYDEDANGWIDEADKIYQSLQVWSKDDSGNDRLIALSAQDIGAIYLGSVASQFSLNNADNQQLGQVRETGLFLKNTGEAGTVQQVDLVI
jgi:hypothetical protein